MDIKNLSRKEVGALGEKIAAQYLIERGFVLVDRNVARKTGEIDVIIQAPDTTLHFVEVKTILCREFPEEGSHSDEYDPSVNLHEAKIRKVARTAEWYVAEQDWGGDFQVDGCLVWLRERDGHAHVVYLPQIV
jgi:putative endonuclease